MKTSWVILGLAAACFGPAASAQELDNPRIYDPGQSGIVTSAWVAGAGMPTGDDPGNYGLVLVKEGVTSIDASAVVDACDVDGFDPFTLVLGYDYRSDGHCGAGAPRFAVFTNDGAVHFLGCSHGLHSDTGVPGWRHVTLGAGDAVPPFDAGTYVVDMSIIFDEGIDTPVVSEIAHPGHAVIDNVSIGGKVFGKPGGAE